MIPLVHATKYYITDLNIKVPNDSLNFSINSVSGDTGQAPIFGTIASSIQCNGTIDTTGGGGASKGIITTMVNGTDVPLQKIPSLLDYVGVSNSSFCANPNETNLAGLGAGGFEVPLCNYNYYNLSKSYTIRCNSTDPIGEKTSLKNYTITFDYDTCKDDSTFIINLARTSPYYGRSFDCTNSNLKLTGTNIYFGANGYPHAQYNLTHSEVNASTFFTFDSNASVRWNYVTLNGGFLQMSDPNGEGHIINNSVFNPSSMGDIKRNNTIFNNVTFSNNNYVYFKDCVDCDIDNSVINVTNGNFFSALTISTQKFNTINLKYYFNNLVLSTTSAITDDASLRGRSKYIQVWLNDSVIHNPNGASSVFPSGNFTLTNVTFNRYNVSFDNPTYPNSLLNVIWYLNLNVTADFMQPLNNSRIEIYDNSSYKIATIYTNGWGLANTTLKEYTQKSVNGLRYFNTNYTLNISSTTPSVDLCQNGSYQLNLTQNIDLTIIMNCTENENTALTCSDGKDNNHNGLVDANDLLSIPPGEPYCYYNFYASQSGGCDYDGDGYGTNDPNISCYYAGTQDDCDDTDINTNPGASEIQGDGKDNDCDGLVDEDFMQNYWGICNHKSSFSLTQFNNTFENNQSGTFNQSTTDSLAPSNATLIIGNEEWAWNTYSSFWYYSGFPAWRVDSVGDLNETEAIFNFTFGTSKSNYLNGTFKAYKLFNPIYYINFTILVFNYTLGDYQFLFNYTMTGAGSWAYNYVLPEDDIYSLDNGTYYAVFKSTSRYSNSNYFNYDLFLFEHTYLKEMIITNENTAILCSDGIDNDQNIFKDANDYTGVPPGEPMCFYDFYPSGATCDYDADGYGTNDPSISCYGAGTQDDPNDFDPTIYPGATELCDGADNDGNGQIDEGFNSTTCSCIGSSAPIKTKQCSNKFGLNIFTDTLEDTQTENDNDLYISQSGAYTEPTLIDYNGNTLEKKKVKVKNKC